MVLERLESLPVGKFHYTLLLVTGLGWLLILWIPASLLLSFPY